VTARRRPQGTPRGGAAPTPPASAPADPVPPVAASAAATPATRTEGPVWADPTGAEPEVGLLLLRDRSLWPPTWAEDGEEVRVAFRDATLTLVANRVGIGVAEVEAHAYFPTGGPPPALVVVELSDRSGPRPGRRPRPRRPAPGLRPEGPPPTAGATRCGGPSAASASGCRSTAPPPNRSIGGDDWRLTADGGFVRITLPTGATWRAIAGVPLWSDGRYVLVRDGDDVVLVDFLMR
jgi:hypothetical protein